MSFTNDDVGQIGQNALAIWAAQVGATANPSLRDVRGWDFLLQFAAPNSSRRGPLDRELPEFSCMMQVKTSQSSCKSRDIKLSNWRRMVSDPIPWFVLLIGLNSRLEPSEAYLVHIDDAWCARVLQRLRQLGDVSADTLHKHTLDITCSEKDMLRELSGRALIDRIRADMAVDQHAYVERKIAYYNSLGYDGSPRELTVSMHVKDTGEFWMGIADLGIGIRKTLPGYTGTKVFDRRFGILGTIASLEVSDGDVEFYPTAIGRARLRLTDSESGSHAEHTCDIYRAGSSFPFLPEEYEKVRFAGKHISLIMPFREPSDNSPVHPSFQLQFPHAETISYRELDSLVTTIGLLRGPLDSPLQLHLESESDDNPWSFGIRLSRLALPEGLVGLLEDMQLVLGVIRNFDVPADIPVKADELLGQFDMFRFLSVVFGDSEGPLQGGTLQDVSLGDMYGAPSEALVHLPEHMLYASIGVYGAISELTDFPPGRLLTVAAPKCFIERAVILNEDAGAFDQNAFCQRMDNRLKEAGCRFLHPRPEAVGAV